MKKTTTEFTDLRQKARLSLDDAASLLEVSLRTAYRYDSGESRPSKLAMRTLRETAIENHHNGSGGKFRFIDLFAGIGGLRVGFEGIGGKCVFTSEWDRFAQRTYKENFPDGDDHVFAGDIREYTADTESLDRIPTHDVLLAGFPCQPFSIAGVSKKNALGRPHGFMCDTQGTLFFDVAQIISHHKPAAFLLENVKNLERHAGGQTFSTIMNVLEQELKYQVDYKVISSDPWVPQRRERIFIVGFRERNNFSFDQLKIPEGPNPTLGSILESNVDEKYTLTPRLWSYLKGYKEKHASRGNGFGYSVFGPDDVTRTLSARYYKDGSEVLVDRGKGRRPRRLTPLECARLMGFEYGDRTWKIPNTVSDTQAYRQFGNAVVVPAVESVAKIMEPHIQNSAALLKDFETTTEKQDTKLVANG